MVGVTYLESIKVKVSNHNLNYLFYRLINLYIMYYSLSFIISHSFCLERTYIFVILIIVSVF